MAVNEPKGFRLVTAWVEGVTPMLQNRATEEDLMGTTRRNTAAGPAKTPRELCEDHIYRLPDRQIAVPGPAFMRLMREAGGSHKSRGSRKSIKYVVPAAVLVLDELCPLYRNDRRTPLTEFEVDSRPVTIPATKGKVMRHRARFNEWSCRITLRINEDILDGSMVRQLLSEGIQQIGIGDYRPEKGGPFGTSSLVEWVVLEDSQKPSLKVVGAE
jgi:hypothetical protein